MSDSNTAVWATGFVGGDTVYIKSAKRGDVVAVRGRPENYRAIVEYVEGDRFGVRPLVGQGMTPRMRSVWRKSIVGVVNNG